MLLLLFACTQSTKGVLDESFTDDAGLRGDVALIFPDETSDGRPPGVLFFFSWDFGDSYYLEEASLHADLAQAHDLILVSMPTPDAADGSECWWAPRVEDYAAYVNQFLQERLVGQVDVDTERIFVTGLSGGSDFAAAFHFHTDYRYGGGSVALCGGDIPRLNGGSCEPEADPDPAPAPTGLSAADLARVRYDFAIDADDELLENSQEAAAFYEGVGFTHVRHRIVEGSGHCGFTSGWEGLDVLGEGLDYVDPRNNPG